MVKRLGHPPVAVTEKLKDNDLDQILEIRLLLEPLTGLGLGSVRRLTISSILSIRSAMAATSS
jgi:hypothetical protein